MLVIFDEVSQFLLQKNTKKSILKICTIQLVLFTKKQYASTAVLAEMSKQII